MIEAEVERIHAFVRDSLSAAGIGVDDEIFNGGYGSSLFAMELVAFVESHFGIVIDESDLDIDNFQSVTRIAALVGRKLAGDVGLRRQA